MSQAFHSKHISHLVNVDFTCRQEQCHQQKAISLLCRVLGMLSSQNKTPDGFGFSRFFLVVNQLLLMILSRRVVDSKAS